VSAGRSARFAALPPAGVSAVLTADQDRAVQGHHQLPILDDSLGASSRAESHRRHESQVENDNTTCSMPSERVSDPVAQGRSLIAEPVA
jgi:hypothetical protein